MNRRESTSMILRLGVALSCSLLGVGILADAVDPIAFGTIKPSHIPLLLGALAHGSPAAMMHIGILVFVSFADLSVAMLMVHVFTIDARWPGMVRTVRDRFGSSQPVMRATASN